MSSSLPRRHRPSREAAADLFYGFDVPDDDESLEFLASLVAAGTAPAAEVDRLYGLSLFAGAEDWDMRLCCAAALRDRVLGGRYGEGVAPYLAAVTLLGEGKVGGEMEGAGRGERKQVQKRRRPTTAGTSPFWTSPTRGGKRTKVFRAESVSETDPLTGDAGGDDPEANDSPAQEPQPVPETRGERSSQRADRAARLEPDSPTPTAARRPSRDGTTAGHFNPPGQAEQSRPAAGDARESPRRQPRQASRATTSHYFTPPSPPSKPGADATSAPATPKRTPRPPRGTVSALPVPPLSADRFGLIQEELAHDPFRLLVAVTFLIRTAGRAAIPAYRDLVARYPTPAALAAADPAEIIPRIRHLGLASNRCAAIQKYARAWAERPPARGVRYGVRNYPRPGDGRDVRAGEQFGPEDAGGGGAAGPSCGGGDGAAGAEEGRLPREDPAPATTAGGHGTSWEIGHLTQGPYALDSWRIFCRDVLLGRAGDWRGAGRGPEFQPEWMRVLPADKELRACLRWMWMREGWEWDPATGEREVLREEMRRAVDEGRVAYDNAGQLRILDEGAQPPPGGGGRGALGGEGEVRVEVTFPCGALNT